MSIKNLYLPKILYLPKTDFWLRPCPLHPYFEWGGQLDGLFSLAVATCCFCK